MGRERMVSHETSNEQPHIVSFRALAAVLAGLLTLTAVTVMVSRFDLGALNIWVAIGVAALKSSLVLLFFMHLWWEGRLIRVSFLATIFTLALLIGFLFWDIGFR